MFVEIVDDIICINGEDKGNSELLSGKRPFIKFFESIIDFF